MFVIDVYKSSVHYNNNNDIFLLGVELLLHVFLPVLKTLAYSISEQNT